MLSVVKSMCLQGLEGTIVNVEVDISAGMPCWDIVGLPDVSIRESKERVRTAIRNSGFDLYSRKYIINLSPANIRKDGSLFDLPIAIAILKNLNYIKNQDFDNVMFIGELSLNGKVNRVNGVLPICIEALKKGIKRIFLPRENVNEVYFLKECSVIGVDSLKELVDFLNGKNTFIDNNISVSCSNKKVNYDIDFSEVKGHNMAKRGIEIAISGGHNLLMIGSPGSGKTMMLSRIPTILPELSFKESLEVTKIHSIYGNRKEEGLISTRPFRNPHYTITKCGLLGGGRNPKPGEISLAHFGVLFLDELLEFDKDILESLRIPIEEKKINIVRNGVNIVYPCSFILIAGMNPCKCGYYGSSMKKCTCSELSRKKYISKLSGPLLDRFDVFVRIDSDYSNKNTDSSGTIKHRVEGAREIQKKRFLKFDFNLNSEIPSRYIEVFCGIDEDSRRLLDRTVNRFNLSSRSYYRILKVARTIADLDRKENIETNHILEAIQYRNTI